MQRVVDDHQVERLTSADTARTRIGSGDRGSDLGHSSEVRDLPAECAAESLGEVAPGVISGAIESYTTADPELSLVVDRDGDRLEVAAADGAIRIERNGSHIGIALNHLGSWIRCELSAEMAVRIGGHVAELAAVIAADDARKNGAARAIATDPDPQAAAASVATPESHS
jgi:hypothetical protein